MHPILQLSLPSCAKISDPTFLHMIGTSSHPTKDGNFNCNLYNHTNMSSWGPTSIMRGIELVASCKEVANVLCAEINGQILSKLRANKTKQQNSFKTKQQTLTRQILILKCSTGENKKKTWMSLNFSNFLYLNTRFYNSCCSIKL